MQKQINKFDYIVYIGRFQIFHNGHLATINKALTLSKKVIVVIGSSNLPRTVKNPFTALERKEFILNSLDEKDRDRVIFTHANDYLYNDQKWVTEIQVRVSSLILEKKAKIGIIGLKKDESSYYLEMFPQWEFVSTNFIGGYKEINATNMREKYFEGIINLYPYEEDVPFPVRQWLFETFLHTDEYQKLKEEYEFLVKYKAQWEKVPYPVIFTTVDAIVIQSGHVLMVKRKACPGEGLWALPGGFLNYKEKIQDAMIRELKEETKIKVPVPVLVGHIKDNHVFDHPQRSERGRTITNAFLIELPAGPLTPVKGGDDAEKAFWVPLEELDKNVDKIYEDHYSIIQYFVGRV